MANSGLSPSVTPYGGFGSEAEIALSDSAVPLVDRKQP